ncbi:MAG: M56 family metallopeptidase [Hyphomonadaceae bacterium]
MSAFLDPVIELNIAAAAAILFVLAVRRPATRLLGPRAVYSLWAIVPVVMAATFLPERTTETFVTEFLIGGIPASLAAARLESAASWLPAAIGIAWLAGVTALALLFIRRQRAFLRDADIGLAGPAIVGFRHPRIITPDDFAHRFSHDERKLILTHEQVHIDRNDARINAFVALLRCVFWFNPLIHIGAKAMRTDQELSCDAEVIDRRPRVRRAYAETLLKTHLVARPRRRRHPRHLAHRRSRRHRLGSPARAHHLPRNRRRAPAVRADRNRWTGRGARDPAACCACVLHGAGPAA